MIERINQKKREKDKQEEIKEEPAKEVEIIEDNKNPFDGNSDNNNESNEEKST